jgi:hypothetical protein
MASSPEIAGGWLRDRWGVPRPIFPEALPLLGGGDGSLAGFRFAPQKQNSLPPTGQERL